MRRLRMARFLVVPLSLALLALAVSVPITATATSPATASTPKACQKGGWMNLVDVNGGSFTSESACPATPPRAARSADVPETCERLGGTFQTTFDLYPFLGPLSPACTWNGMSGEDWGTVDDSLSPAVPPTDFLAGQWSPSGTRTFGAASRLRHRCTSKSKPSLPPTPRPGTPPGRFYYPAVTNPGSRPQPGVSYTTPDSRCAGRSAGPTTATSAMSGRCTPGSEGAAEGRPASA